MIQNMMEGEDLRTWKNKIPGQHLVPADNSFFIKREPHSRMQCELQDSGTHITSLSSWNPSDVKREPGCAIECHMNNQLQGPSQIIENLQPPKDFNPGKVTGCLVMCGQTPTLVFVEGAWPSSGDVTQLQPVQPPVPPQQQLGQSPAPVGAPFTPVQWQYQCPRCDHLFSTPQELNNHESGGSSPCPGLPPPPHQPAPPETGSSRGRRGRPGGRTPRKKKSTATATPVKEKPPARFRCSVCDQEFAEEQQYNLHEQMNSYKPVPCTICKLHFSSESSLSNHTKHFHKEKHKCPFCTRQYTWKIKLHNHMKQHMDEQILVGVFGT